MKRSILKKMIIFNTFNIFIISMIAISPSISMLHAFIRRDQEIIPGKMYLREMVLNSGNDYKGRGVNWYYFYLNQTSTVYIELFFKPIAGKLDLYLYQDGNPIYLERARYDSRWSDLICDFDTQAESSISRNLRPGHYRLKIQEVENKSNIFNLRLSVKPLEGGAVLASRPPRYTGIDLLPPNSPTKVAVTPPPPTVAEVYRRGYLVTVMSISKPGETRYNLIKKILGQKGVDIEESSEWGRTALHLAVIQKDFDVASLLLDKGADENAISGEKMTPLHYAVENKDLRMVELLIDHDAKTFLKNHRNETALETAEKMDIVNTDIIKKLKSVTVEKRELNQEEMIRRQELREIGFTESEINELLLAERKKIH